MLGMSKAKFGLVGGLSSVCRRMGIAVLMFLSPVLAQAEPSLTGRSSKSSANKAQDAAFDDLIALIRDANPHEIKGSKEERQKKLSDMALRVDKAAAQLAELELTESQDLSRLNIEEAFYSALIAVDGPDSLERYDRFYAKAEATKVAEIRIAAEPLMLTTYAANYGRLDETRRDRLVEHLTRVVRARDPIYSPLKLLIRACEAAEYHDDDVRIVQMLRSVSRELLSTPSAWNAAEYRQIITLGKRIGLLGERIEIEGEFSDGKPLDWSKYRGKVVLLVFWSADETPEPQLNLEEINQIYERYSDQSFTVLGINLDVSRAKSERHLNAHPLEWPTLLNQGYAGPVIAEQLYITEPYALLIDQHGCVADLWSHGEGLERRLKTLLGNQH